MLALMFSYIEYNYTAFSSLNNVDLEKIVLPILNFKLIYLM